MSLQEKTVGKMVDQDIDSLSVVGLLREADILALSLSTGQRLLLTRWVSVLRDMSVLSERCVIIASPYSQCMSDSRGTETAPSVKMSTELEVFKTEAERMGLQEKTVSKMVDQDIDSLSVVVLMREADISALSLSLGQLLLLSRWVSSLRCTNSRYSSPSEPAFDEATS